MGILRVLSRRGDDRVTWSTADTDDTAVDPEVSAAVREAERIFREQKERGATAFRIEEGGPPYVSMSLIPRRSRSSWCLGW